MCDRVQVLIYDVPLLPLPQQWTGGTAATQPNDAPSIDVQIQQIGVFVSSYTQKLKELLTSYKSDLLVRPAAEISPKYASVIAQIEKLIKQLGRTYEAFLTDEQKLRADIAKRDANNKKMAALSEDRYLCANSMTDLAVCQRVISDNAKLRKIMPKTEDDVQKGLRVFGESSRKIQEGVLVYTGKSGNNVPLFFDYEQAVNLIKNLTSGNGIDAFSGIVQSKLYAQNSEAIALLLEVELTAEPEEPIHFP